VMRVGVVGHRGYRGLPEVMHTLSSLAPTLGFTLYFEDELLEFAPGGKPLVSFDGFDLLLTLGGDGTMLRAARLLDGRQVPMLGINLGRLGFLTCCGIDEMESSLRRVAAGEFQTTRRMMLDVRAIDADGEERQRWSALNDAVLHKGGFARVVGLRVSVDGELIAAYAADGLVIATPAGSTAYSLSAGGPIVVPTVESIVLSPISPHTLAIRPVVLPPTSEVTVQAVNAPDELLITVDGQVGTSFGPGETLAVRRADDPVLLVRFPETTFFSRLRRKLAWGGLAGRDEDEQKC
jgi:NAD+ kinase